MVARPQSWSQPADRGVAALAAVLGVLAFLLAWAALHEGFYTHRPIVDTPVYESYGDAVVQGRVPYRDFAVEYPPGALPVFVLPALGTRRGDLATYERHFGALMAVCGAAAVVFLALALAALGAGVARMGAALCLAALAPLALGSLVLTRFDLWPVALTAAALAALLWGRLRLGFGVLAAGVLAKLFPALLFPPALVYVWRRRGRREALVCAGVFLLVLALVAAPFAAVAPGGLWDSFARQAERPLQIESLGSAFLLAAHHVGGVGLTMKTSSGSQNLVGELPDAMATASTVLQALAVTVIWITFARGPARPERLVLVSAAAVTAFVAFGKVLSPQFLLWLVPLVPLVGGRRGVLASLTFVAALVLTQIWFPYRYWRLALDFDAAMSWLVLARDLLLVALTAFLAAALSRAEPEAARS